MNIQVLQSTAHVLNMRTRMPFRFGIVTMTATPHLFLRLEIAVDGQRGWGIAADHLPPKWFTKNPQTPFKDDVADMLRVIRHAVDTAIALPQSPGVYRFWKQLYSAQSTWIAAQGLPPLLGNFGPSLVERAVLDAFCRITGKRFADILRGNLLGIDDLPLDLLPAAPLGAIIARHTVGLSDPITPDHIPVDQRVNDGLPQSLDQCIQYYGLTHFKIKLCGDVEKDLSRLRQLARVIEAESPDFAITLDGNENFHDLAPFRALWQSLMADSSLKDFLKRLIFVEQPFHRGVALGDSVRREMLDWRDRPPIIIDESDATLESFPRALECGYIGTSHKNCKGIFKGITNACRIAELRRSSPQTQWVLSGEDLSNVGPVALLQDLAVTANLGIASVERNGHHYFRGLSYLPQDLQQTILSAHRDLYRPHERGFPTLNVRGGKISVASVVNAPFGVGFEFDPAQFTPLEQWSYDSIG